MEKCCLLLVGNESFANAEKDIQILTGIKIPHSTQHRIVNSYQLPEPKITKRATALSVDGGTVRLRTPLGHKSEWKNYKAVKIHDRAGMAFFQDNQGLLNWVNQQPLSRNLTCLGDGHDGVWNLIEQIGEEGQRREVLDWYHLIENLHKVGGSNRRLKQAKNFLWQGLVNDARWRSQLPAGSLNSMNSKKNQPKTSKIIFANTHPEFPIINLIRNLVSVLVLVR